MSTKTKKPRYVTIWKDPESGRGGLLTHFDNKKVATRDEDQVARATNRPHVLQDTPEDREFLDAWLQSSTAEVTANPRHTFLAVPLPLARDVLGWDL